MTSRSFISLIWWRWSSLSLKCVYMFIQSSCFLSFKERTLQGKPLSGCFQIYKIWKTILKRLNYVQCLNIAPMEKALWPQRNITLWVIAPMEKAWFYKRLFFEVAIAMVKEKKYSIKYTTSVKISFMHYM